MKRSKADAADRFVNEVLAAVRRYKSAKDAPAMIQQVSLLATESAGDEPWQCPHVERCANRSMCAQASILGRPEREKAAS